MILLIVGTVGIMTEGIEIGVRLLQYLALNVNKHL